MSPEEIQEAFAQTLAGNFDDELPWEAVSALRRIGSREIFEQAAAWCDSDIPIKRARGADILAQLGRTVEHPKNSFVEESFSVVSSLARREKDPLVLSSALHALGGIGDRSAVPLLVEHWHHDVDDVRFAVATALGGFADNPLATNVLLALMQDQNADIRDWATFGLGVLGSLDSDQIRIGLAERLADTNCDVREEALVGLAKRKDRQAVLPLLTELERPEVSCRIIEAAQEFLGEDQTGVVQSPDVYISELRKRFPI